MAQLHCLYFQQRVFLLDWKMAKQVEAFLVTGVLQTVLKADDAFTAVGASLLYYISSPAFIWTEKGGKYSISQEM